MSLKFPSIPEPGSDAATQLNTLRVIKQVVELLAANATGDKNVAGPGTGAQIFALQEDVKRLLRQEASARAKNIDDTTTGITNTVDDIVADLNKDISDARNKAIQARADALAQLDTFEQNVAKTFLEYHNEVGDVKADLELKAGTFADADKAMSGRIDKAAAYVGLNEASWKSGDLSVATRFGAMSTGYKEYVARTGDNFMAGYTSQIVTLTGIDTSISTAIENLEAKITVPGTKGRNPTLLYSAILSEQNAVADATKKMVTAQNLNTTIASLSAIKGKDGATQDGAITAAVKVESDARVKLVSGDTAAPGSVDKRLNNIVATAQYSVVVSTTGAKPAVTGFRLVSDSSNNTSTSDFMVYADKFSVTNGTVYKPVFVIDTVSSKIKMAADVAIDGNLVVTGTINNGQIADNAVSNTAYSQGTNASGGQSSWVAASINLRAGSRVSILATYAGGDEKDYDGKLVVAVKVGGGAYTSMPYDTQTVFYCMRNIAVSSYAPGSNAISGLKATYYTMPATHLTFYTAQSTGTHTFAAYTSNGFDHLVSILVMELSK